MASPDKIGKQQIKTFKYEEKLKKEVAASSLT